jgi:hypothetical protein
MGLGKLKVSALAPLKLQELAAVESWLQVAMARISDEHAASDHRCPVPLQFVIPQVFISVLLDQRMKRQLCDRGVANSHLQMPASLMSLVVQESSRVFNGLTD